MRIYMTKARTVRVYDLTKPGDLDTFINVLKGRGFQPGEMRIKGLPNYAVYPSNEGPFWLKVDAIMTDPSNLDKKQEIHTKATPEEVFERLPPEQKEPLIYVLDLLLAG